MGRPRPGQDLAYLDRYTASGNAVSALDPRKLRFEDGILRFEGVRGSRAKIVRFGGGEGPRPVSELDVTALRAAFGAILRGLPDSVRAGREAPDRENSAVVEPSELAGQIRPGAGPEDAALALRDYGTLAGEITDRPEGTPEVGCAILRTEAVDGRPGALRVRSPYLDAVLSFVAGTYPAPKG